MCMTKEEAKTKLERLIEGMERLASTIHSLNETLVVPPRSDIDVTPHAGGAVVLTGAEPAL